MRKITHPLAHPPTHASTPLIQRVCITFYVCTISENKSFLLRLQVKGRKVVKRTEQNRGGLSLTLALSMSVSICIGREEGTNFRKWLECFNVSVCCFLGYFVGRLKAARRHEGDRQNAAFSDNEALWETRAKNEKKVKINPTPLSNASTAQQPLQAPGQFAKRSAHAIHHGLRNSQTDLGSRRQSPLLKSSHCGKSHCFPSGVLSTRCSQPRPKPIRFPRLLAS